MVSAEAGDNVVGAVIFFSYIGAALTLIAVVVKDLLHANRARRQTANKQQDLGRRRTGLDSPKRGAQVVTDDNYESHDDVDGSLDSTISVMAALAALSLATLSYHMICFLVESYQAWDGDGGAATPHRVWAWAVASRLFRDFGEALCATPSRFWWTHLALAYSMGWNVYMSIQGVRHSVPRLWAYFLLDQILPVSLTQNLFLVALLLLPPPRKAEDASRRASLSCAAVAVAYFVVLEAARRTVGTSWFVSVLLTARALLFAPLPVSLGSGQRSTKSSSPTAASFAEHWRLSYVPIAICAVAGVVHSLGTYSPRAVAAAFDDHHAVSTLGYDFLIASGSLAVFSLKRASGRVEQVPP